MSFSHKTEEYYKNFIQLQEKLRKSEEERLKLEMKFNEMVQITREEEQIHYRKLRSQYKRFLDEDRRRQDRNDRILTTLERIESRVAILSAKTERFKLLRQQYNAFLERIYKSQTGYKKVELPSQASATPPAPPPPRIIEPSTYSKPKFNEQPTSTYAKQLEEKNNILEKYLQDMSSQRLRNLLDKEEIARSRLPFSLSSGDDKLENSFGDNLYSYGDGDKFNYANSIADDIMNSIYSKQSKFPDGSKLPQNIPKASLQQSLRKSFEDSESEDLSPNESNPSKLDLHQNVSDKKFENSTESLLSELNEPKQKVEAQEPSLITDGDFLTILPQAKEAVEHTVLNDLKYEQPVAQSRTKMTTNHEERESSVKDEKDPLQQNTENIASKAENSVILQEVHKDAEESEARELTENLPNENQLNQPHLEQTLDESKQLLQHYDDNDNQLYDQEPIQYDENQQRLAQQIQQQYDENGQLIQHQYDENGQLIQQQYDENGQLIQQQYDENGQLIPQQPDKNAQLVQQHYDENGQLSQQQYDENGQLIQQQYDENGQLIQQQYDENGQLVQQRYDENGQLIQEQYDENNQVIQQQYDKNGQLIQQQYDESGQLVQQQYDENGQLIQQQYDESGQLIQQQYDENNQLIQQQYDENGQLIQQQYDESGQLIQQQYDENGQLIQQQYDENGQLIQQQYDDSGQLIQQQYDENNQLIQQQYDENGQLIQQQYDESGQLIQQQYDESGHLIQQQYDENGQLIQAQYNESGQLIQQQYDENEQLIQAQYDENGQLIQAQYDENGQLIQAQYDETGQLIQQQQFDETGQPIQPQYVESGELIDQPYGEEDQHAEADAVQKVSGASETEQNVEETKTSKLMEMLDTDTESSAKIDTAKVSNESDFDFSNE